MKKYLPGLIAAAITGICLFFYYENRQAEDVQPLPVTEQQPEVPTYSLANGAEPLGPGQFEADSKSTIQVSNGTSTDVVVKFVNTDNGQRKVVRNIYIPKGELCMAENLPEGAYELIYAYGIDWNETEKRFNRQRSFSVAEKALEVRKTKSEVDGQVQTIYGGHKIDLKGSPDGNFPAYPVNEKAFNEV